MVSVYTDGSCKNNGFSDTYGACGYIIINEENTVLDAYVKSYHNVTNNQMEMLAIIEACKKLKELNIDEATIYSDSSYCINCYLQKWYVTWERNNWITSKKTPVLNQELWKELIQYFKNDKLHFVKVKGHANNIYNNMVDDSVQKASLEAQCGVREASVLNYK